ncbi:hypothetical protein DF037_07735 [Burkholderia contaminans]|uniref:Uncharacterized protein n=1 Tax=Burkholderia contaminans TaxID=488447 RepID=A0A3N8RC55_9BURK|nr:hypothetical protein DF037_07735 [Burkholderia contaminans]
MIFDRQYLPGKCDFDVAKNPVVEIRELYHIVNVNIHRQLPPPKVYGENAPFREVTNALRNRCRALAMHLVDPSLRVPSNGFFYYYNLVPERVVLRLRATQLIIAVDRWCSV